jgi:alkanesulfonate monooxygenase SsuD/methylene tetrahydromethanopterin reductase-like flavin-dependent oxidoreductase (luciferase family)
MKVAINVGGEFGLTWQRWQQLTTGIEQLGFDGIFCSDHFVMPFPPTLHALEALVSLTYLATHSQRVHFGTLVAPLSFRDPVMLARQAMALDDLSGGRMILGVGAGWMAREHTMFGYELETLSTRLDRFAEGLEVITQLVRSDEPVNFAGHHYQLHEAQLLPRPQRATPIMVGGNGPKRTLPLVARYADIWNCSLPTLDVFKQRSALLDELLAAQGRQPSDVKRTVMLSVLCWRNPDDLEQRVKLMRDTIPQLAALSTEAILELMRSTFRTILGSPEHVIEQIHSYATAGAEEVMLQWTSLDDIEGLEILAEHVVPYVRVPPLARA